MDPSVTVIVCTRDRPRELERCLQALQRQRCAPFDLLIVDNGTGTDAAMVCRAYGAAYIREPQAGLTRARNLGARAASGHLVAYIDDDAIAEPGWLEALVCEFADPQVGAAVGRTRYMHAVGDSLEMTESEAPESAVRRRATVDRTTADWFTRACFGGIGDGNTMAFRRRLLTDAVRFDERIGRGQLIDGGDEHVAFASLIADGYRVVHTPAAVVRHPSPFDRRARRERRCRDLRSSTAYFLFIATQFPAYRPAVGRLAWHALVRRLGGRRGWQPWPALSIAERWRSVAEGCRRFWLARRSWSSHGPLSTPLPRTVQLR
ncbi:MAG: glycosyltransferase [Cyanobacteria bacterium]|nr:glycosyltransferase [Cyanobacteriota bacterium]